MTETAELPVDALLALAREAGEAIMAVYHAGFDVEHKDDRSPVTEADLAAHRVLTAGLARLTPDIPVLSEEAASETDAATRAGWHRLWLVDPLDGTREFINRREEFTVNLALVEDGRPRFGIVYCPATAIAYWGGDHTGAWRSVDGAPPGAIRASDTAGTPLRVLGSRSHRDAHMGAYLEQLGDHELVSAGSSLKFCRLAEGAADLYPRFGPTMEWDTAAGQAVAEAAGARVTRLDGSPLRYNKRDTLLNPFFLVYADARRDWLSAIPASAREARAG